MKKIILLLLCVTAVATLHAQIITTFAGTGVFGYTGDGGQATAARFDNPWCTTVSPGGTVYISDFNAHVVRKVSTTGIVTTVAGNGTAGSAGTGGPATLAELNIPRGIVVDGAGTIFIADQNNQVVRKVSPAGFITNVVGTGVSGFSGDGGQATAAKISYPQNVALDRFNNLYISDYNHVIRKVNSAGVITTIAGTSGIPGYLGDGGPATAAQLNYPYGMAFDTSGNMYFADNWNNVIRRISTTGVITTVAGTGTAGYSGDAGAATSATLNRPTDVAIDKYGNLYIADQVNNVVRKVNAQGTISTFAGNHTAGYIGDGGLAIAAELNVPADVTVDTSGKLYIADNGNFVVRKIGINNHAPFFTAGALDSFRICENSGTITVDTRLTIHDSDVGQNLTWSLISGPGHGVALTSFSAFSASSTIIPSGLTYTPNTGFSGTDTFKVRISDGIAADTIMILAIVMPFPNHGFIIGSPFVCIGTPSALFETVSGGVWSISNGNATVTSTGAVNGLTYGLDTVIYTVSVMGCISDTTFPLSVLPVTDLITGPGGVCVGAYVPLTGWPAGGVWTANNPHATVTSGGLAGGVTSGVDTIVYTVTNACGTSVFEKQMYVNDLITPSVNIEAFPGFIVGPGQYDTLICNLVGGTGAHYTYTWYLNNAVIPGATDSFYISDTFVNHDSVTVMVSNNPCSINTFGWAFVIVSAVGVPESYLPETYLSVIPNPTAGFFTVTGRILGENNEATLEIIDILGRVRGTEIAVIKGDFLEKSIYLADDLPSGLYLLRVTTESGAKKIARIILSR
jgi:Bacterial Ig domain/Secretion system C-terminal sorting domain